MELPLFLLFAREHREVILFAQQHESLFFLSGCVSCWEAAFNCLVPGQGLFLGRAACCLLVSLVSLLELLLLKPFKASRRADVPWYFEACACLKLFVSEYLLPGHGWLCFFTELEQGHPSSPLIFHDGLEPQSRFVEVLRTLQTFTLQYQQLPSGKTVLEVVWFGERQARASPASFEANVALCRVSVPAEPSFSRWSSPP